MIKIFFVVLMITLGYSKNYYFSPGFNITFNEDRQVNIGCQFSIGMRYDLAQFNLGVGAIYSLKNQKMMTYNFFGGGITFIQFEYGNIRFRMNGKIQKGKRKNLLFGSPYSNTELFHSFEFSTLNNEKIIKRYNWIKFPIFIK